MSGLVRFLPSCFWATSEQRICRLTNCRVTVLGRYSTCLFVFCPQAWIFVSVTTLLAYLGWTANPGRDDLFAIIIHAWTWDATRFLELVWLPLIPSLLNVVVSWALRFLCCLEINLGEEFLLSLSEFPSNVLCPAHCVTWCGRRMCSSCTHVRMAGRKLCFSLPHPQPLNFF